MVGEIHRAPDSRSARRVTHSEMAESRRAGGWETGTRRGGDAPGRKCFAAFGKRLSSLRVRPVGSSVAPQALSRRSNRGAFRGRYRAWLSGEVGGRPVSGGTDRENVEVQPGAASREDATFGIRSLCDRQPRVAWRRETRDVQLPRLYPYLRKEEE